MAVVDVAFWDPAPGIFAWRFPNSELNTKTQLIVTEGQEAYLFNSGQAIGPFGPGRHVLDTSNYPVLKTFIKMFTGGVSPFRAEVWFVSKSFKLDIKWGTASAIQLEDPKYNIMLPVRAFGQYGLVIDDSSLFLIKLIGMVPAFSEKVLSGYFKGIVVTFCKDLIAKYLIQKNISILQISAYLKEISEIVEQQIAAELAEYGLRAVNFTINSISTDEEDAAVVRLRKALATKAEMDIIGFNYQQKRTFDTMETAAANPGAGSTMNAGMGMGMGIGMGVPMGNMFGNMANSLYNNAPDGNNTQQTVKQCPKCKANVQVNAEFCSACGQSFHTPTGITCDKCGKISPVGSNFCSHCGDYFNCCPACGSDNPVNAVVCTSCGAAMPVTCPACGQKVAGNMKFCSNCGSKLTKNCPNCNAELAATQKFCAQCGSPID